jgi:ribosomal protein S1
VRVIGVDKARNRVSLSTRSSSAPRRPSGGSGGGGRQDRRGDSRPHRSPGGFTCNPFANL